MKNKANGNSIMARIRADKGLMKDGQNRVFSAKITHLLPVQKTCASNALFPDEDSHLLCFHQSALYL
tara:strand:+ start:79 stop:279 length:201 start_codon:yes stop_codon:yes gene_type:complete